jgi:hypothetical protein
MLNLVSRMGVRLTMAAFLLCAARLVSQTEAQIGDAEPTISTDRPSVANSSVVVPRGYLQAENGFLITSAGGQSVADFPETSLRFGLLDKTELRVAIPDFFHTVGSAPVTVSGFGDLAVGVKQQIGPIGEDFNLAAIFFLSFPIGANAISSHGYDPGLQFPWSKPVSKNWTAEGQVAFYWPTLAGTHNFTGETTFVFDRQLTAPWDAFVEYAGDFPERGGSRQIAHFGSSYKIARRQQIDFQLGAGLSHAAPHAFIGAGYSFLLRAVN